MIAWVAAVVVVMWQAICGVVMRSVRYENGTGGSSPSWRSSERVVDRAPVEPGRRPRLQAPQDEAETLQRLREHRRWFFNPVAARPPGGRLDFTQVNQASQERPRRQDHAPRADFGPGFRDHPGTRAACIEKDIGNRLGADFQIGLLGQQRLHGLAIELAVGLRARPTHRRPLGKIERPELDAGPVDRPAHDAVERIDLAHQVPLAQSADRRIAGHLADRIEPVRQQQRAGAQPRRRGRGLAAGMAAADHDHVIRKGPLGHGP